jgi:photosystem II stability/assembly factor-like uncharacterized protein
MRTLLTVFFTAAALAQPAPNVLTSHTTENLRGVSAVTKKIAWASGTHGTYLRTTDGGRSWRSAQVPGAGALDFRGVVAFSVDEAFLMSAGPGEQSRIYHTADAGQHWSLQFTASNPKSFFDSMALWDSRHGVVLGDPIPDESGKLKFELLLTDDGQTWHALVAPQLPPAKEGEGAFAASNTCLAILSSSTTVPGTPDPNIWFATGGRAARVFHSADRGQTWQVTDAPIVQGPDSAGIFSIAFRDATHGVIAGGDYKHPDQDGPNLAFTTDGGKTWTLSPLRPLAYFSAAAYDRSPTRSSIKGDLRERIFLVGHDFIFDFRPPQDPTRISPRKKSGMQFNAISSYPEGGALIVGPKGSIARLP